jgi:hypothetical protein
MKQILLFSLLFMLLYSLCTEATLAQSWQPLGPDDLVTGTQGFSPDYAAEIRLAFGPNGTPYVVYSDAANGYKASVMKFNGSAWQQVGTTGFSAGSVSYPSIAVSSDGTPYVAYSDGSLSSKVTVQKFSGGSWQVVGIAGFSNSSSYVCIAVDGTGTPFVAYKNDANSKVVVQKFTGGSWQTAGGTGITATGGNYNNLAFDNNGVLYVAYMDGLNNGKATLQKFDGNTWQVVGTAGFSSGVVSNLNMALDGNRTPYVTYVDFQNNYKLGLEKFSNGTWQPVATTGLPAASVFSPLLAFNGNTPYLAYTDNTQSAKATVKKFNGSSWEAVGPAGFTAAALNECSFGITGNKLVIAYTIDQAFAKSYDLNATLPVKLLSLDVRRGNGLTVDVNWNTAGEYNNHYFTLYRSADGINYTAMGRYPSKGNQAAYTATDHSPVPGKNYYKLQQTDQDGKTTELGIRLVDFQTPLPELKAWPNLSANNFTVWSSSGQPAQVYNTSGQVVAKITLAVGENTVKAANWPGGIYFLKTATASIRLVKQ